MMEDIFPKLMFNSLNNYMKLHDDLQHLPERITFEKV